MENIIIAVIVLAAVGGALLYIRSEKKKGRKCIGCPASGCSSCHCGSPEKGGKTDSI